MKKVLLVAALVSLIAVNGFSQFGLMKHFEKMAKEIDQDCEYERNFTPEFMQKFKASTLVFFIYKQDVPYTDLYQKILSKVWTITPFILAPAEDYAKYATNPKYAWCMRETDVTTGFMTTAGGSVQNTTNLTSTQSTSSTTLKRIYFIDKYDKKGRPDSLIMFAQKQHDFTRFDVHKKGQKDGSFIEIKTNLLTTYKLLQSLNKSLISASKRDDPMAALADPSLGKRISNDTLYMLNYASAKRASLFNLKYDDNSDVMKVYPYKYRFCTYDELYQIFITENRGRLLLDYDPIHVPAEMKLDIYDFKEGKYIYRQQMDSPQHFCITEKDIKKLLKKADE